MKKIISFDLDGTLVNGIYGEMVWNHGVPSVFAQKYAISFDEAKSITRKAYESVGDGRLEWYDIGYWLNRFGLPVSADELLTRYEPYIELLPYAQEVLEVLIDKYVLVIASNAARIFVERELSCTGIGPYFTHIISATSDYKLVKKGDAFYGKLLSSLNVSPHEIVHVGDHEIFDFAAPARFGIDAYHLSVLGNGAERVIPDLRALLDKL
jgi:FMN phosphatase YigB (HAD superfamily)